MKLPIMLFSSKTSIISSLWVKIFSSASCSQTLSMCMLWSQGQSFTPIQNHRPNYTIVYSNLHVFIQQTGRHQLLNWRVALPVFTLTLILWRIDPLLGNDSVNTFPREPTLAIIRRLLLGDLHCNTPKTLRDNRWRCFPWVRPEAI
jgi:hypothetical protein